MTIKNTLNMKYPCWRLINKASNIFQNKKEQKKTTTYKL